MYQLLKLKAFLILKKKTNLCPIIFYIIYSRGALKVILLTYFHGNRYREQKKDHKIEQVFSYKAIFYHTVNINFHLENNFQHFNLNGIY